MSLSVAQRKEAHQTSSGTTFAIAFSSAVTAGDLLVISINWGTSGITVSKVTDSVNGSGTNWTQAITKTVSPESSAIYYIANSAAGTPTVTITWSGTVGANGADACIRDVTGAATSSVNDGTGSSGSGTSTAITSGSLTTTNANDLLVGCCSAGGTVSAGEAGWTANIDATTGDAHEDIIESSTGSFAATFTQSPSSSYTAVVYAFKAASGGGNAALSSTVSAKATVTGTFTDIRPLSGTISAKGTLTGTFTDIVHLSSTISGKATVTGTFTDILHLTGSAAGKGSLAGTFTDILHLASITSSSKATVTGTLISGIFFNGTASAKATVTGNLNITAVHFITPGSHGSANVVGVLTLVSPPSKLGPPVVALVSILPLPAILAPVPTQSTLLPQNPVLTNQVTSGLVGCSLFLPSPEVVLLAPTSTAISEQTPVNTAVGVLSVNPPAAGVIPDSPVVVVVPLI